jgi:Ankyrin repeats (3 copies)
MDLSKDPGFLHLAVKDQILKHCKKLFLGIMDPENYSLDIDITKNDRKEVFKYRMGKFKWSLLHIAVAMENSKNLAKFLENFCSDLDIDQLIASDKHGISAMHIAAQANYPDGIDLLKNYKANIDVKDSNGFTPLYHATHCKNAEATTTLIRRGAALNSNINPRLTTLAFVLRNMPSAKKAIIERLNESINLDDSLKCRIYLDFNFTQWKMKASEDEAQSVHAYDLLHIFAKEEETFEYNDNVSSDLIEHPLVQKLLEDVWTRNMHISYWFIFIFKLMFMIIITIYVFSGRKSAGLRDCLFCFAILDSFRNMIAVFSFAFSGTATKWDKTVVTYYLTSFQFYCYWTRLIGSFFFLFSEDEILLEMMSPMIFLAGWFDFMIMVGETNIFGIYMDMFFGVLTQFLKVLGAFSIFLLGFALCFWLYFHKQTSFSMFHLVITRIIVMFIGEIDFNDLIVTYFNQNLTAFDGTSLNISPSEAPHWYLVFPLTCIILFIIAMPIVLHGLLIGIVVNDIPAIYGKAAALQSKRSAKHIELMVTSIDSIFGFFIKVMKWLCISTRLLSRFHDSILRAQMDDNVRVEYFFGNKPQPKYLHKAFQILVERKSSKEKVLTTI